MQTWKVELIPETHADFNGLDGSVKKQVLKQLVKLEKNPKYGVPLGNKAGINLKVILNCTQLGNKSGLFTRKVDKPLKLLPLISGKTWKSTV